MKKYLVTGGAGYIGSHTCVELIEAGHTPIVIDNLSNSNPESLHRVAEITGKTVEFIEGDVRDEALLEKIRELDLQAFITATNPELFASFSNYAEFWEVKNNTVTCR